MTKSRILLSLVMALVPFLSFAQSNGSIEAKTDSIKLDENYIYGEGSDENREVAFDNALSDMMSTANGVRQENGKAELNLATIKSNVQKLEYNIGQRNVVFLYMPLKEVLALTNSSTKVTLKKDVNTSTVPVKSTTPSSVPVKQTTPSAVPVKPATPSVPVPDDVTSSLCAQDNWTEIKPLMVNYKQNGKIKQTGNTMSMESVPDDAYAILMDNMGGILSVLSPKKDGQRVDLKENNHDNNNCKFIVWYK